MRREATNLTELRDITERFLRNLAETEPQEGATVVGLSGDLGAGKTAFTKVAAEILGITETITSPTFILEKIYELPEVSSYCAQWNKLVHIDAYRLHHGDEMQALGWRELLSDSGALVFLEWPEQVPEALPHHMHMISCSHVGESTRAFAGDLIS